MLCICKIIVFFLASILVHKYILKADFWPFWNNYDLCLTDVICLSFFPLSLQASEYLLKFGFLPMSLWFSRYDYGWHLELNKAMRVDQYVNSVCFVIQISGNDVIYSNTVLDSKVNLGGLRFFDTINIPFRCQLTADGIISQGVNPVPFRLIMRIDAANSQGSTR